MQSLCGPRVRARFLVFSVFSPLIRIARRPIVRPRLRFVSAGVIALHAHVVGGAGGEHDAALVALLYLPAAVLAFLLYVDVAARLGMPGARAYFAAYAGSGATVRLAALLLAISATVHLAIAPGHAADPRTAALFLLDAAALTALAVGAFVLPWWRPLAAALLVANVAVYAGYVVSGREAVDAVGIGTKLVEVGALALLTSSAVVGKEVPTR